MSFPLGRSALVRIAPFALFVLLLWVRGAMREGAAFDARWVYGIGVLLCAAALLAFWREYGEFARQNLPTPGEAALAAVVGGVVFVLWITLDAPWTLQPQDVRRSIPTLRIRQRFIGFRLMPAYSALNSPFREEISMGTRMSLGIGVFMTWRSNQAFDSGRAKGRRADRRCR